LEDRIDGAGLFPEVVAGSPESKLFESQRCHKFEKPTIFLTARVHPGEVQSSYVLKGLVDFLMSHSKQAKKALEHYNFKIIPLLNPDGVARGYYRLDTHNHNLNRFYLDPDP
jgi:murein tripeptide amidase MpaA